MGADRDDTRDFVAAVRARGVTPHVARNDRGVAAPFGQSLRRRKLVEEVFGWLKTVGGGRDCATSDGSARAWLELTAAAYNLVRLSRLEPVRREQCAHPLIRRSARRPEERKRAVRSP